MDSNCSSCGHLGDQIYYGNCETCQGALCNACVKCFGINCNNCFNELELWACFSCREYKSSEKFRMCIHCESICCISCMENNKEPTCIKCHKKRETDKLSNMMSSIKL